jgi:hypothetical protein
MDIVHAVQALRSRAQPPPTRLHRRFSLLRLGFRPPRVLLEIELNFPHLLAPPRVPFPLPQPHDLSVIGVKTSLSCCSRSVQHTFFTFL